jgi:hypothetical protein
MEANGTAWAELLERDLDPDTDVVRHRDDGTDSHAPWASGSHRRCTTADHRSCLHRPDDAGVEPPPIDAWDFAEEQGRLSVVPAAG